MGILIRFRYNGDLFAISDSYTEYYTYFTGLYCMLKLTNFLVKECILKLLILKKDNYLYADSFIFKNLLNLIYYI